MIDGIDNTSLSRYATPDFLSRNATVDIPLRMLGISVPHLVRPLDDRHIAELVETDETEWEPIEVRAWPAEWHKPTPDVAYHVVSGNHRTSAAQIKNLQSVRARVIEAGDELSYMLAAIRTNARHGRNFTEDERKMNAAKLKGLGQSADQIAKLFGVNRATVYNWLSGRDSNAGKKEKKEAAMRMLAAAEADRVDADWSLVPDVQVSDKQMMLARTKIHNFLAETPVAVEKSHVIAWLRSLSLEMRQSHATDMRESLRWLQNVVALLEGRHD